MSAPGRISTSWRLASVVLFCGVPLMLVGLIFSSWAATWDANQQTARQAETRAQIVAQLAKRQMRHAAPADVGSLYLASTSNTLARAEIQEKTTKLVEDAGGHLAESQFTGSPEQEADGTIAIQVSLDIDNKGLFDLLYALETGMPLMTVTNLNVHKTDEQNGEMGAPGLLKVDMTVEGHFRKSEG